MERLMSEVWRNLRSQFVHAVGNWPTSRLRAKSNLSMMAGISCRAAAQRLLADGIDFGSQ
jgi:hypothetical protein